MSPSTETQGRAKHAPGDYATATLATGTSAGTERPALPPRIGSGDACHGAPDLAPAPRAGGPPDHVVYPILEDFQVGFEDNR